MGNGCGRLGQRRILLTALHLENLCLLLALCVDFRRTQRQIVRSLIYFQDTLYADRATYSGRKLVLTTVSSISPMGLLLLTVILIILFNAPFLAAHILSMLRWSLAVSIVVQYGAILSLQSLLSTSLKSSFANSTNNRHPAGRAAALFWLEIAV
jgi:hypothetical protein